MKLLSIDIGFKNIGIAIIYFNDKNNEIENVNLIKSEHWNNISEIKQNLNLILISNNFNSNIDICIIENQIIGKNKHFMYYINGFLNGKGFDVKIVNPISSIRKDKTLKSRKNKKQFSIDIVNQLMLFNDINYRFDYKNKDDDICDAFNIGFLYLYKNIINIKKFDLEDAKKNIKIKNLCVT